MTDDEFYLAAKAGVGAAAEKDGAVQHQLVSVAIPKVFFDPTALARLSWKEVARIRADVLPLAEKFYAAVEDYQTRINTAAGQGKEPESFALFCEFCERVAISARPFAKETSKILRTAMNPKAITFLNGIVLPTVRLLNEAPELNKVCDVVALGATVTNAALNRAKARVGFEYLENVNRGVDLARFRNQMTCLIPAALR